jgi:molybdopterin-binding protein
MRGSIESRIDRRYYSTADPGGGILGYWNYGNSPGRQPKEQGRRSVMKLSARNTFKAKVSQVKRGAVNTEIVLEVTGPVQVVSIITNESADSLGMVQGKDAYAIIKASSVMVGTD